MSIAISHGGMSTNHLTVVFPGRHRNHDGSPGTFWWLGGFMFDRGPSAILATWTPPWREGRWLAVTRERCRGVHLTVCGLMLAVYLGRRVT